jgi:hypothetical protein
MTDYQATKDVISRYLYTVEKTSVRKIQNHLLEIGIGATQAEIAMICQELKEDNEKRRFYKPDIERK